MTEVGWYIDGCTYTTAAVMLGHHLSTAHPVSATAKTPPIHKPRVSLKIHEDAWDCFYEGVGRFQTGKQHSGRSCEIIFCELLRS